MVGTRGRGEGEGGERGGERGAMGASTLLKTC